MIDMMLNIIWGFGLFCAFAAVCSFIIGVVIAVVNAIYETFRAIRASRRDP